MKHVSVPEFLLARIVAPPSTVASSAQVEAAHADLLTAMADLAIATNAATPDREEYTRARWRLSKANRRRQDVWERVHKQLRMHADPADVEILSRLAATNDELRRALTAHIGRWSADAIDRDWLGYCEASRTIRWTLMSIVRHERRDVVPMLQLLDRAKG